MDLGTATMDWGGTDRHQGCSFHQHKKKLRIYTSGKYQRYCSICVMKNHPPSSFGFINLPFKFSEKRSTLSYSTMFHPSIFQAKLASGTCSHLVSPSDEVQQKYGNSSWLWFKTMGCQRTAKLGLA